MGHCVLLFQPASACFSEANLRECGRVSGIYTRECQVRGHYTHLQQTRGKYFGFEVIFVVIENLRWPWIMMRHASHAVWPASMEQKLLSTPFHNSHFIRSVLKYSSKGPTRASKSLACDRDKNIIRNCILWVYVTPLARWNGHACTILFYIHTLYITFCYRINSMCVESFYIIHRSLIIDEWWHE